MSDDDLYGVQGYAVKAGMLVGRGELLLFMDADGATRVSDVEKLEAALAIITKSGAHLTVLTSVAWLALHPVCMLISRDIMLAAAKPGSCNLHTPSRCETVCLIPWHAGKPEQEGEAPVNRAYPRGGLGMAVGSRAHLEAKATSQRSWYRNLLMHGFHFVVLLVVGGAIKDTQCGFKVTHGLDSLQS